MLLSTPPDDAAVMGYEEDAVGRSTLRRRRARRGNVRDAERKGRRGERSGARAAGPAGSTRRLTRGHSRRRPFPLWDRNGLRAPWKAEKGRAFNPLGELKALLANLVTPGRIELPFGT